MSNLRWRWGSWALVIACGICTILGGLNLGTPAGERYGWLLLLGATAGLFHTLLSPGQARE